MTSAMWAGRRGRAQALLQANLALDAVSRDVQRVCTMRKERSAAREELAREEYVRLFSMEAIDERCGVRQSAAMDARSISCWLIRPPLLGRSFCYARSGHVTLSCRASPSPPSPIGRAQSS